MWKRSIVFNFSWVDCFTQEKLTTNQCTRGKQGVFWAVELNGFNHLVQFKNCLDTIQILQYGVLICKKNKTSLNISSQIINHVLFHSVYKLHKKIAVSGTPAVCNNLSTIVLERCMKITENSQLRVRYRVNKSIKLIGALLSWKTCILVHLNAWKV